MSVPIASKVYQSLVGSVDKHVPSGLRPLWQHPAGPKTVFFWAPVFKWGLVAASLSDIARPADKLSIPQCASLACTGLIWSRYSLVIIPKNYGLFSVNLFVAIVNIGQLARAYKFQMDQKEKESASVKVEAN
ncbi:MPC2 family protein [Megaselia abdita]